MSPIQHPTVSKKQAILAIVLLSFGVGAVVEVALSPTLYEATMYFSWFVLLPLVFLFGDRLPFIESPSKMVSDEEYNPVHKVRGQFARGEIDEDEFEWRIEQFSEEITFDSSPTRLEENE